MENDANYYDSKWKTAIKGLPNGGAYRFDLRQHGYNLVKKAIPDGSTVFDYACGLGIIDIQLEKEKNCKVSGCDFSPVAVDYAKSQCTGDFRVTDKVFNGPYDVIIAIYFLEHIPNPVEWCEMCFEKTEEIIVVLPRNFLHHGEHVDMAWKNWSHFFKMFEKYNPTRLDIKSGARQDAMADRDVLYPMIGQFAHPIIKFTHKGGIKNAPIQNIRKLEENKEGGSTQKKRTRRTKKEIKQSKEENGVQA